MARDPIFPLRLPAERREAYAAAAKALGVTLTAFARQALDAAEQSVAGGSASRPARTNPPDRRGGRGRKAQRTEMCVHRLAPEAHCSRCDG